MSNNQSWLDLLDSSNSSDAHNNSLNKTPTKIKSNSFERKNDEDARFIEIEIFDAANQKKFDKLANDKKIKSPFKRRLDNEVVEKQVEKKFKENNDNNAEEVDSDADENSKKPLRKRFCSERSESSSNCSSTNYIKQELETDQATLDRRQKQIDYGKNTIGYDNYMREVPKHLRTRDHPKTPPKHLKYSRRAWEGLVKSWRKKLHAFDPTNEDNDDQD